MESSNVITLANRKTENSAKRRKEKLEKRKAKKRNMTGSFIPNWRKDIEKGERGGRSKANSKCLDLLGTPFVDLSFFFFANVQIKMLDPCAAFWVIINKVFSHTGIFLRSPTPFLLVFRWYHTKFARNKSSDEERKNRLVLKMKRCT